MTESDLFDTTDVTIREFCTQKFILKRKNPFPVSLNQF